MSAVGPVKPRDIAAMHRRAAVLFTHSRSGDLRVEGILAVLDEMDGSSSKEWTGLVLSLLNVGNEMAAAAEGGCADEYLRSIVRVAALGETGGPS
jgi:hypothetical protein